MAVKAQGNFARSPWLQKGSVGEYSRLNFESHTPEINEFTVVEIYVLIPSAYVRNLDLRVHFFFTFLEAHRLFSKTNSKIMGKFQLHLSGFLEASPMPKQKEFLRSVIGLWR